ncbi:hypothetical protein [uncultured Chryseobacterium sp.]|uniref:hypothetical protein n=1 Tax=uncultured Chryseobacterium sp. TaxID=259322 RepID=UPI0025FA77CC|nr:hypothetical protein [uncultured Chryseobacterium sp.]
MPKNENGDYTCINHPDVNLGNKTFVSFNQMVYNPASGQVAHVGNAVFPAKIQFCPQCGYIEMYTIKAEEDFPNFTGEIRVQP